MYRCSIYLSDFEEETAEKEEKDYPEKKEEETNENETNQEKIQLDDKVRVLIMNEGYRSIYHTEVCIICRNRPKSISAYSPAMKCAL